ncbi:ras-related protein Rab-13-like isoform X1 [Mercenaria mercenaria]|uniref:ras-related protein Rab-13-like isoform X1 n=1 Tax=Mercenaria mercenaria TaxID=6596 RepID=UPI00234F6D6F|nr:ras-related protein Rab-13-like isoform X1 [Mercenaria mercenaria]XP_045159143.2 ras-related protein Rab-13-like isoform X1 [Mercenaria mercenaria]
MAKSNITHLTYNIVVMGDPYCGKSSIIERYTSGKYGPNYVQTIGSEYSKKELVIDGNPIMLYVYDTAGQEDMRTVIKNIYRKAQGILLVFDFSRKKTLDNIRNWIDLIQMNCDITPELMLVGNKADLEDLKVTSLDAKSFAESHNMPVLAVSAKKNHNIDEAFDLLSKKIFANRKRLYPGNMVTSIHVHQEQKQQSNCCT